VPPRLLDEAGGGRRCEAGGVRVAEDAPCEQAGVIADLLESRRGALFSAGMWGLLSAVALWNVVQLARLK